MGRPERKDVDYFPFYVKEGRTLFVLENKYGCQGTGFFTNLFRFLSRTPDHHFSIATESDKLYFFASVKCDSDEGMDMIELMVTTGKLDKQLWEEKQVLASSDFLDSINDAYRRRSGKCIRIDEIRAFFNITTDINKVSTDINPQSKVKETKSKETKSKDSNIPEPFQASDVDSEILNFALDLDFPSIRGTASRKKNISVIKARLADEYSPEEIKDHLTRFINRKQIHSAYLDKYGCDPDIGCKAWCPRLTWRIMDVLSPDRMDKYYSIWEAEGLLDVESTIEQENQNGQHKKDFGRNDRGGKGEALHGSTPGRMSPAQAKAKFGVCSDDRPYKTEEF